MIFEKNISGITIYVHIDWDDLLDSLRKNLMKYLKFRDSICLRNPYWDAYAEEWIEDDGYSDIPF